MEQIQTGEQESGSSFLPFYDLEPRLDRSIRLIELMESLSDNLDWDVPLGIILRSTLEGLAPTRVFLLAPYFDLEVDELNVIALADLSGSKFERSLNIGVNHPLAKVIQKGNICVTQTNGEAFNFSARKVNIGSRAIGEFPVENEQLLVIPLLDKLVARSALILVIKNEFTASSDDLELLSSIQAMFSFFFFKAQHEMTTNSESASQHFAFEVSNGLSETQLHIGRLIFQEKSDSEILKLLGISPKEFEAEYAALLDFLMVKTRDEVAAEIRVLNLK